MYAKRHSARGSIGKTFARPVGKKILYSILKKTPIPLHHLQFRAVSVAETVIFVGGLSTLRGVRYHLSAEQREDGPALKEPPQPKSEGKGGKNPDEQKD